MASHLLGDFNPIWTLYSRKGSSLLQKKMNKCRSYHPPNPLSPFSPFSAPGNGPKSQRIGFHSERRIGGATQGLEILDTPWIHEKIHLCSNYVSSVDNWYWLIIDPIFPHEFNWKKCWSYFARNSDSNVFLAEISLYTSWPEKTMVNSSMLVCYQVHLPRGVYIKYSIDYAQHFLNAKPNHCAQAASILTSCTFSCFDVFRWELVFVCFCFNHSSTAA